MPFERGQSGNPKGRPRKGKSLTEALEKVLKQKRQDGRKNYDALATTLIELALQDKNIQALRYIYDRVDGKPRETVELENGVLENKLLEVFNNG
jgi:hypothetical protein